MATIKTSHYAIFDYWKDKCISMNGEVSSNGEYYDYVVHDFGEPSGWGCGKPVKVKNYERLLRDNDLQSIWNGVSGKLERCHIIPNALGGEDKPSNLFLLCHECHLLSPDTSNPKSFLRWIKRRQTQFCMGDIHYTRLLNEIDSELKLRGVEKGLTGILETLRNTGKDIDFTGVKKYILEHLGTHCTTCVESSKICVASDLLCKYVCDLTLE